MLQYLEERGTWRTIELFIPHGQLSQPSLLDMERQRPQLSEGRSGFVCGRLTNHFSVCWEIRESFRFGEKTVNVVQSRTWPAFPQPQTPAAEGGTSPCSLVSSELTAGGTGELLSSVTMSCHGFFPSSLIHYLAGITPVRNLINVALLLAQVSSDQVRNAT